MKFRFLVLPLILLAGCGPRGAFPSLQPRAGEQPRVIAAPGAAVAPSLAPEQREGLKADLAREGRALADAQAALATAGAALERALAGGGVQPGTPQWNDAQMLLSRLELARAPLADIEVRLVPLRLMVDSLEPDDADRIEVEAMVAAVARTSQDARARTQQAAARLGG